MPQIINMSFKIGLIIKIPADNTGTKIKKPNANNIINPAIKDIRAPNTGMSAEIPMITTTIPRINFIGELLIKFPCICPDIGQSPF